MYQLEYYCLQITIWIKYDQDVSLWLNAQLVVKEIDGLMKITFNVMEWMPLHIDIVGFFLPIMGDKIEMRVFLHSLLTCFFFYRISKTERDRAWVKFITNYIQWFEFEHCKTVLYTNSLSLF